MKPWLRVRMLVNLVNLSTPLGLLIARIGGCSIRRGDEGLYMACGYRFRFPIAPAFTVGNVVLYREADEFDGRPDLLAHESRHATQYAWCVGLPMLPMYAMAAGVSLALSGDPASYNPFERLAGLAAGGYERHGLWFIRE
jgi:hypothetical protein